MINMDIEMLNHAMVAFDKHDLDDIIYVDDHESNFSKNLFDSSIFTELSDVIPNHSSGNISTSVSIPVKAMAGELSPFYLDKL